ncbi:hypothetical protein [Calidifontibacillus erzurumensis]|uniref:Type IV pilus assembly protein PilO n=1 Tax=Calidifontibacillus erzurumensis TaxID=2741433 RepID=A0A8J8KEA2_9BACI|nr:hypothetical protein [Calidifontibacillus erzurumensis]NSL51610.1 hypothetical protein [Calidifontibacillus erzurumensis]
MNLRMPKKNFFVLITIVIALAIVAGAYFYFISPLNKEINMIKDQLETEEKLYETLAAKVGNTKTTVLENSRFLQKKLPVDSFVEQFIFDLEKAEVVSNSFIENMSFQDVEVSNQELTIDQEDEKSEEANNEGQSVGEGAVEETTSVPAMPEGIKRVTVNLSVNSKDYFDLLKFLDTIERLERITKIDSLTFSGGKEILELDQELEELHYSVVVSTYYYPALEELRDELPVFDMPPPSNKDNPLPTGMYYKK